MTFSARASVSTRTLSMPWSTSTSVAASIQRSGVSELRLAAVGPVFMGAEHDAMQQLYGNQGNPEIHS